MAAVRWLARAQLRRRWRSVVVLTVLVGFAGAVVLALAAGTRRTSTSLDRFQDYSRSADIEVTVGHPTGAQLREFAQSPGVESIGRVYQMAMTERTTRQFLAVAAQQDDAFGVDIDRPVVLRGRLPRQSAVGEVAIGESLAQQLHLDVGDRLHFDTYRTDQIQRAVAGEQLLTPEGPPVSLEVTGIVRRPLDLGGRGGAGGVIVPTRAFYERYHDQIGSFAGTIVRVRTDAGEGDVARVTRAARRIFGAAPEFQVAGLGVEGRGARNAIHVTTVALVIAAAIAALFAVVGVWIALSREVSLVDVDQVTLRALGMRRSRRAAAASAVAIPVACVGAVLAGVASVAASPLFPPQGTVLPAEIDRIRQIDRLPLALALFVVTVAMVAVGFALVTAVRRRRRDLAVLKTLGFRRRQVRATVAWHATTIAVVALAVGVPLGLLVGRFTWRSVADELGVSTDPTLPLLAMVALLPAALLAVNLVAAVPARRAANTRPAVVLRSE